MLGRTILKKQAKRIAYVIVLVLLAILLIKLGSEPWRRLLEHWPTASSITITTAVGIVVQAQAFRAVSTAVTPRLVATIRIWSASAVVSVVAPLFAGLGTRTAMFVQSGMSIGDCVIATLRQLWLGVEYAFLVGGLAVAVAFLDYTYWAPWPALLCGAIMLSIRRYFVSLLLASVRMPGVIVSMVKAMSAPVRASAHKWFLLQLTVMAITYYIGFNGLQAPLTIAESFALASATVLVSVLVFVPNGLGITDAIWAVVATRLGISISEAAALAIMLRLSHLMGGILVWSVAVTTMSCQRR